MIIKGVDEIQAADKFSKAGFQAERQMAFYLKREFEDLSQIYVLNSLRLENNGDPAQIDHLIIYSFGMIIIESKSITGKVIINSRGEWSHQFSTLRGMASPIKQVERQATFLRKYLETFGPQLYSNLGDISKYDKMPIDLLVAISDSGVIQRGRDSEVENVYKADFIPDKIKDIIKTRSDWKTLRGFFSTPFIIDKESIEQLATFLIKSHQPINLKNQNLQVLPIQCKEISDNHNETIPKPKSPKRGFCIRCHKQINLDPKIPYCKPCYSIWKTHQNKDYEENYCHICGFSNKSTLNRPSCHRCYEISKDTLEYFLVKK